GQWRPVGVGSHPGEPRRHRLVAVHSLCLYRVLCTRSAGTNRPRSVEPGPQRLQPILHVRDDPGRGVAEKTDLLALFERTRAVVDGNLQRPVTLQHQLDDEIMVKIEAVALEPQSLEA